MVRNENDRKKTAERLNSNKAPVADKLYGDQPNMIHIKTI